MLTVAPPRTATRAPGHTARRDARLSRVGVVAAAVTVGVLAVLPFGVNPTALGIVALGLVYGLFTYGLDLSWGRAGLISVGQAAFFGLGAYGVAVGARLGIPLPLAALAGVVVATLIGAIIAALALRVESAKAVPLFILFTLATSQLLQRAATSLPELTGGSNGLTMPRPPLVVTYYVVLAVVVIVVALTYRFVVHGRQGLFQLAVVTNPVRAESIGIGIASVQTRAFAAAAGVSAIAGALFAPVAGIVTPASLGLALSTSVLAWLAVGGRASIAGPFAGAVVLTVLEQTVGGALRNVYVFGLAVAFIAVVLVAPTGVAGLVRSALRGGRDIPRVHRVSPVRPRRVDADPGSALLEVHAVEQRLGGAVILRDVSLAVSAGQIVALIGPNGAGKSTLLSVVAGSLRPTRGSVSYRGTDVTRFGPARRARMSMGRLFQVPSVFAALTVADNRRIARVLAGTAETGTRAFGADDDITAGELSMAQRRNLELDLVLAGASELVLLDEPAAGLSHADARTLAQRLRATVADTGCAMLVVEHDMELVREVADIVVVLADGRVIARGTMDDVVAHDAVRRAYLGGGE